MRFVFYSLFQGIAFFALGQLGQDGMLLTDNRDTIFSHIDCAISSADITELLIAKEVIHGQLTRRYTSSDANGFVNYVKATINPDTVFPDDHGYYFMLEDFFLISDQLIVLAKYYLANPISVNLNDPDRIRDSLYVLGVINYEEINPSKASNDVFILQVGEKAEKKFRRIRKRKTKEVFFSLNDCFSIYQKQTSVPFNADCFVLSSFFITPRSEDCNDQGYFRPTTPGELVISFSTLTGNSPPPDCPLTFIVKYDYIEKKIK